MGIEFELKYRATEAQLTALEAAFLENPRVIHMHTRYYDTPCRDFARRKLTLRCRMENGSPVCTLKTPAGGLARREYELPTERIEEAAPELCRLAGFPELIPLLAEGLQEVCGARFVRTAGDLVFPGFRAELALDRGVLTGGGKELPLCEAEAELKDGSREALGVFGLLLERKFCLVPEALSKFRRALDLAKED